MKGKLIVEFISTFLLGSIPCFIYVYLDGNENLFSFLESLITSNSIFLYFVALTAIQLVVSKLGKYQPSYKPGVNKRFKLYYAISNNVGGNLASLYRVLSGAIFASAIIASFQYEEAGLETLLLLWVIWPVFLIGAFMLSSMNNYSVSIQR